MRQILTMRLDLEIEIDPKNPAHMAKAAQWLNDVAAGKLETPEAELGVSVAVRKEPELVRRADD